MSLFNFKKKIFYFAIMSFFVQASGIGDFANYWEGYESLDSPSSSYQDRQVFINLRANDLNEETLVYISNSYFIYNGYLDWADHYFSYDKSDDKITFSRRFNTPLGIIGSHDLIYKIIDYSPERMSLEYVSSDSLTIHKLSVSVASLSLPLDILPRSASLESNYPNPFNPATSIPIVVNNKSEIIINIYNSSGQLVKEIYKGLLNPGEFLFKWDGSGQNSEKISSGLYFCKLIMQDRIISLEKMILLK